MRLPRARDRSNPRSGDGRLSIYYSIFRKEDGFECTSGFSAEDRTNLHTFMKLMRERVDAELADADPWGENADRLELDS